MAGRLFLIRLCTVAHVCAVFLLSCHNVGTRPSNASMQASWDKLQLDAALKLLHSGDLVLRTGNDATSYMLRQCNQRDKTYSHCGIVLIERGYPFVYHCIGGEDNPDARLRRDSVAFFFSDKHNLGFAIARYDLTSLQLSDLQKVVHDYYRAAPRFDLSFDLATDDKLYCAEFVYKALNKATGDNTFLKPTHIVGYTFVGIDDLFVNKHARLLWQVKYK